VVLRNSSKVCSPELLILVVRGLGVHVSVAVFCEFCDLLSRRDRYKNSACRYHLVGRGSRTTATLSQRSWRVSANRGRRRYARRATMGPALICYQRVRWSIVLIRIMGRAGRWVYHGQRLGQFFGPGRTAVSMHPFTLRIVIGRSRAWPHQICAGAPSPARVATRSVAGVIFALVPSNGVPNRADFCAAAGSKPAPSCPKSNNTVGAPGFSPYRLHNPDDACSSAAASI
jgi:hypothetical protein